LRNPKFKVGQVIYLKLKKEYVRVDKLDDIGWLVCSDGITRNTNNYHLRTLTKRECG
jgi:hypothetical protein